jgi:TolB-like protein/Tfp pilus assembly protein PilF
LNPDSATRRRLRFGPFALDPRTAELTRDGTTVRLPPQPARILALLAGRQGDLVTREELRQQVWGRDTFVEFDQALNFCVRKIRAALGDDADAPRYVETLSRRGYRFIATVEEEAAAPLPAFPRDAARPAADPRAARDRVMLVVLPFENLSGDPAQDYFSDGLTEEMITRLGRLDPRRMGVIARTSAMRYRGVTRSVAEIASELGVQYLLEGSVRATRESVRVSAQLIRASDQTHLWADVYDRPLRDVLALQADIARAIAVPILLRLAPEGKAAPGGPEMVHPGAYKACLRGRFFWNKRTANDTDRSIREFKEAVRLDPGCAEAYVGLADAYAFLGDVGIATTPPRAAFERAALMVSRALELNPDLGEAHASRAHIAMHLFDWAEAAKAFERALDLAPNYPVAHEWYAFYLAFTGRIESAHAAMARALALDPISLSINKDVGELLYFDRRYEEALAQYRRTLEMDATFLRARIEAGRTLEQLGRFDEAIAELREATNLVRDNPEALAALGHALAAAGRSREARAVLGRLDAMARSRYVSPYDYAVVHAGLRQRARAFAWLERAASERAAWLIYLSVDPRLDRLRSDPRFRALARRVGVSLMPAPDPFLAR